MIPWIPHTYIILYRAIYLIPVYICITGATYIHTRTRLVTTKQHHGSGASVIDTATAPTLAVVSPPLRAGHQHPDSAELACWAGQGGGKGASHSCREKAGGGGMRSRVLQSPGAPRLSPHGRSLLREKHGYSVLSVSPPPHLGPWVSAGVSRSLCQWHGAFWNVWGARGGG